MDKNTVIKMAQLSRLHIAEEEIPYFENALKRIFALEEKLKEIDTTGIEPMFHSLEGIQPMREDVVTAHNERDLLLSSAPKTIAGLYLVPKVIE